MQDYRTVVLDGDCALIVPEIADCTLEVALDGECGIITEIEGYNYPVYTGSTVITPLAYNEQVLETRNKTVLSDITVLEVPYWETSNTSGMTAYIANEV